MTTRERQQEWERRYREAERLPPDERRRAIARLVSTRETMWLLFGDEREAEEVTR
jgi:uncharacterized protein (DUF2384 family)